MNRSRGEALAVVPASQLIAQSTNHAVLAERYSTLRREVNAPLSTGEIMARLGISAAAGGIAGAAMAKLVDSDGKIWGVVDESFALAIVGALSSGIAIGTGSETAARAGELFAGIGTYEMAKGAMTDTVTITRDTLALLWKIEEARDVLKSAKVKEP